MTTFEVISGAIRGGRQAYVRDKQQKLAHRAAVKAGRIVDVTRPIAQRIAASFLPLVGVGLGVGAAFHFATWVGLLAAGVGCQLAHYLINGD